MKPRPKQTGRRKGSDKPHYVYGLTDPDTGEIRYIGLSNDPIRRYKQHMDDARGYCEGKAEWLKGLRLQGREPGLKLLDECPNVEAARIVESAWIATLFEAGVPLTNGKNTVRSWRVARW